MIAQGKALKDFPLKFLSPDPEWVQILGYVQRSTLKYNTKKHKDVAIS